MILITKIFKFDAAHTLPQYDGKCRNLHGHAYKLEVTVAGSIQRGNSSEYGMIMDFSRLKEIVKEHVIDKLDHSYLNDIPGLYPTAELMLEWICEQLHSCRLNIVRVRLRETDTSYVEWRKN